MLIYGKKCMQKLARAHTLVIVCDISAVNKMDDTSLRIMRYT